MSFGESNTTLEEYEQKIPVTTNINSKIKKMLEEEGININRALEFGAKFLLAEVGAMDYPMCKMSNNLANIQKTMEELNNKEVGA